MTTRHLMGAFLTLTLAVSAPVGAARPAQIQPPPGTLASPTPRSTPTTVPAQGTVEVAFSPKGGATAATVRFIGEARQSIRMAAYGLTSNPIGKALVEAKKRGVEVRVVVDKNHNGQRGGANSVANYLGANGIALRVDTAVRIQHNKVVIVDGHSVQNGSFNFTSAAETSNAENIVIHRGSPGLARLFTDNWTRLWDESEGYRPAY